MMPEVEELFRDAEKLYEEALKELEVGRLRKTAENTGVCFYLGICEPVKKAKRRIFETKKYIEDVRRFALSINS